MIGRTDSINGGRRKFQEVEFKGIQASAARRPLHDGAFSSLSAYMFSVRFLENLRCWRLTGWVGMLSAIGLHFVRIIAMADG